MMNLEALHSYAEDYARRFYLRFKMMPPTILAVDDRDRIHILMIHRYTQARPKYQLMLATYFVARGIHRYAHVSEAWMARVAVDDVDGLKKAPSEHANRLEVVAVGAVDAQRRRACILPIQRSQRGEVRLGEPAMQIDTAHDPNEITSEGLNGLLELVAAVRQDAKAKPMAEEVVAYILEHKLFDHVAVLDPVEASPKYQD